MPQYERIVVTSLDAMGWGGLYDDVDGGFFHYATGARLAVPHTEKLLETNAGADPAVSRRGRARSASRGSPNAAADALRYVQTWLAEPVDGGWFGSQQADDGYYAEADAGRAAHADRAAVARLQFADSNAAMASAALHAARVFDDDGLRAFALTLARARAARRVPARRRAPRTTTTGSRACAGSSSTRPRWSPPISTRYEATGNVVYEMMAEELAVLHHPRRCGTRRTAGSSTAPTTGIWRWD